MSDEQTYTQPYLVWGYNAFAECWQLLDSNAPAASARGAVAKAIERCGYDDDEQRAFSRFIASPRRDSAEFVVPASQPFVDSLRRTAL